MRNTPPASAICVRKATSDDASAILELVAALAQYEKLTPPDDAAKARLIHDMSGDPPRFEAFLAEFEGRPAAYAIVLETYSSFLALPTLYVEDFFVLPEYRGKRVGYVLFTALVNEAYRRGCGRVDWTVLDWNRLAIDFYKKLGGVHMRQWQHFRLDREDMGRLLKAGDTSE